MAKKKKKVKKTGKKPKKVKKKEIKAKDKPKFCPKCGPGIKLANHKDRWSCGKCGYYEKK